MSDRTAPEETDVPGRECVFNRSASQVAPKTDRYSRLRAAGRDAPNRAGRHSFRVAWGLALAGAPLGSHAQVIDQYLNTDIPGYGAEAGVTVASRAHPEYEAQGVRLGSFVLTPVLTESAGYDDNVLGSAHARGSALIETDASLGVAGGWSDTTFGGALTVDDVEYLQQSAQSTTDWSAAVGASHDFGRDTLSIGATHLNLVQTPRDLDVPLLDGTAAYRVEDVRAQYRADLGRWTLEPGVDVSYYNFDNGRVDGVTYLQSYRDRLVFTPSLVGNYEFATRRRVVVVLRDTQSDFDRSPPGQPRQNFNDLSALAGLAYDADGIIGFRLLGGYEERSFSSGYYRTIQAPILEAAVTWTPTGLTTVTGTAARYIEDSAAEATVGFTETALKLTLDHEYLRNVVLSAHASYFLDDYPNGPTGTGAGSQDYFTGGVGVSWRLNRHVRLGADYTYSTRHSDSGNPVPVVAVSPVSIIQTGEVFGGNYSENTIRLTLRLAL